MMDSTKAVLNGFVGVGIWWTALPMVLQMLVSVCTIIYIIIKIKKELKNG
jgi:hypothetical protein